MSSSRACASSRTARRAAVGLGLLDAQAPEVGFDLGDAARRRGLALARLGQPRPRRLDALRQLAIAAREQHLLPAAQLLAQPLVAARLRGLPLQRAALLFDLEDDVVDARQVLLRRFELQLGGAAAGLVLRDAGGFLDQLAPIGRPRAEDHPDLALLDDGVGLGAEARVHQQLVDVPQPAHFAVDQVLALARAVQPPRDVDVAGERTRLLRGSPPSTVAMVAVTVGAGRRGQACSAAAAPRPPRPACARRCR